MLKMVEYCLPEWGFDHFLAAGAERPPRKSEAAPAFIRLG
jgi:hypothetical protein